MKQTYETLKRQHWRGFPACFTTYHLWNTDGGMSSPHLAKSASAARSPSTARPITAHCFAQYKQQSFNRAWSRAFANQSSDTINETRRRFDSRRRAFRRNLGAGAFFVIGNALEVVGLRQKNPQIVLEVRIILKDESLRGVKSGEIGGASGILVETDAEHDSGALKMLPSLPKKPARFRRHRSIPSRRISRMSDERSR
jgi:hypothetical protein